jgi:ectoine hydroxylase-related dioxygenase (phytanoyl-CoA dioxygenase family)
MATQRYNARTMNTLSDQQIRQFQMFGFLVLRNILTDAELKTINDEFETALALKDKSERIAGVRRQLNWSNLDEHSAFIQSLIEHERFYSVAKQLLGDDAVGFDSNSNLFSGDRSPWHPDLPLEFVGLKFTFYLSAVDANCGALRVIPGSHKRAFSDEINGLSFKDNGDDSGLAVNEVPCHVCDSQPGDAVLFDYRVWHASWGGSTDRRMVSLQYLKNPKTQEEKQGTRTEVDRMLANRNKPITIDRAYSDYWLSNQPNNPDRARWIAWLREWGLVDQLD